MKLKNQVVSLEYAKQLKELGFEQESLFVWVVESDGKCFVDYTSCWAIEIKDGGYGNTDLNRVFYPAYTVAELGAMLPINIHDEYMNCYRTSEGWECMYGEGMGEIFVKAKTEANTRAKMLCYLKQNNLI